MARRHPALAAGQRDAPHRWHEVGDFALESGQVIRDFGISYVEHGIPDPSGERTIVGFTAIGSNHHRLDFLIGPGKALDPERFRIVVIDSIGNGLTTSPSNSRRQPGPDFPRFGIRDMVAAHHRLLTQALGLKTVLAVAGASMGGMQALQWGASHPAFAQRIIALTPMARTSPWSRVINEAARRALMGDPAFLDGRYTRQPARGWRDWAVIMRVLAARTPQAITGATDFERWLDPIVEGAAQEQLDANDYIAQTRAYDGHDLGATPGFDGNLSAALAAIRARVLIAAPPLDLFNPVEAAREAAVGIRGARFMEISSACGHSAATAMDPAAAAFLNRELAAFLSAR